MAIRKTPCEQFGGAGGLLYKPFSMFSFFKPKSEKDRLEAQYRQLLKEAHALSTTNRRASDLKAAEAAEVLKQLEKLQ
jgi:hypothetical protein